MRHFGLDVHQARTTVVWFDDEEGEISRGHSLPNSELADYLQSSPGPCRVVMEAGSTSCLLARQLGSLGLEVVVVDAHKAHRVLEALHRGKKTDKVDAAGLARLSASEWLTESAVWVPDERTHQLRQLTRTRAHMVKHATMLRNALRAVLRGEGLRCQATDLTAAGARAWLDAIAASLPPMIREGLHHLPQSLAHVRADLAAWERCCRSRSQRTSAAASWTRSLAAAW